MFVHWARMLYYFTVIRVLYDFQNHTAHTGSTLAHALSSGAAFPFKIDRFRFRGTLPDTERKKERKKGWFVTRKLYRTIFHDIFYSTPTIGRHVSDRRFQLFYVSHVFSKLSQVPRFHDPRSGWRGVGEKRSWRRQEKSRKERSLFVAVLETIDRSENAWKWKRDRWGNPSI